MKKIMTFLIFWTLLLPRPMYSQQQSVSIENVNGHEYVDLGLSVKWATENVEGYFAWGEIETKSNYKKSNSKTNKKEMTDISGNEKYDAARVLWGGNWRIPTKVEVQELLDECTWTLEEEGYKVTGKNGNSIFFRLNDHSRYVIKGNSRYDNSWHRFWTSTPTDLDKESAHILLLNPERSTPPNVNGFTIIARKKTKDLGSFERWAGCSIRPVIE